MPVAAELQPAEWRFNRMHMQRIDRQHARLDFTLQHTRGSGAAGKGVGGQPEGQAVGPVDYLIK